MNSHIEIPDEIDEKLKKNRNILSRQILKTQTLLILQQIFLMIMILIFFSWDFGDFVFFARPLFFGLLILFLYFIIRFIKEIIEIRRKYFLKDKQNLGYLSEDFLIMVKIYGSKFRIFKMPKLRNSISQDNKLSIEEKMNRILKYEKQFIIIHLIPIFWLIYLIIIIPVYLTYLFTFSLDFGSQWGSPWAVWYKLCVFSTVPLYITSYLLLKQTKKWFKGYQELKAWGDLLDKFEIIPKQRDMALLDKDFNNLELSNDE